MYKTLKNHGVFTIFQLVQDFSHQQDHTIYTYILLSGHQGTLAFLRLPAITPLKKQDVNKVGPEPIVINELKVPPEPAL